jgi:hypothetical protein
MVRVASNNDAELAVVKLVRDRVLWYLLHA